MKQTIITIYALVLCGICTIAFTGYAGTAIFQIAKYSTPRRFVDSGEVVRLSSNDLFWQSLEEGRSALAAKGRPTEADLTSRRNAKLQAIVLEIQTSAFSEAIQNSILAAIFGIIGLGHLLLYKRTSRTA